VDEGLLRELLGEAELRELLDPDCVTAVEEELQQLPNGCARAAPTGTRPAVAPGATWSAPRSPAAA
jgi:hypothetical protein